MNLLSKLEQIQSRGLRVINRINEAPNWKLLTWLSSIYLIWRILTMSLLESSGDAAWKWRFLRYFTELGQWFPTAPDHHQGRWGSNLIVMEIMRFFGTDPWVYCIYPMMTGLLTGILLYLIISRLSNRFAACSAFMVFLLFPLTAHESSQFQPMLPAACCVLLSLWLILLYFDKNKQYLVFLSGLAIGVAYGCKFTSLYWAFAFALFLSLYAGPEKCRLKIWKFRIHAPVILYSAAVLLTLIIETLILNMRFGVSYGRIQMILGGHISSFPTSESMGLAKYLFSFLRPLDFKGKFIEILPHAELFLGGILVAFLWLKKKDSRYKLMAFSFIVVYLLHSYIVYKVFPFLHPERAKGRYFLVLAMFCMIFLTAGWKDLVCFLQRYVNVKILYLILTAYIVSFFVVTVIWAGNRWKNEENPVTLLHAHQSVQAIKQNPQLPVVYLLDKQKSIKRNQKLERGDGKNMIRWEILLRRAEDLVELPFPTRFFQDEKGKIYAGLLNSEKILPGKTTEMIVLRGEDSSLMPFTLLSTPYHAISKYPTLNLWLRNMD